MYFLEPLGSFFINILLFIDLTKKKKKEAFDHLFLHCPYNIGLWNKLFNSTRLVWVSPRRIEDMFTIAFGSCKRGKTLWQIACLSLVWFVWQERYTRIFEDKERMEGEVWDLFYFVTTYIYFTYRVVTY